MFRRENCCQCYSQKADKMMAYLVLFKGSFTVNLALFRPANQSSSYDIYHEASKAVDGDIAGLGSCTDDFDPDPWWKVQLAYPVWVFQVEIHSPQCELTVGTTTIDLSKDVKMHIIWNVEQECRHLTWQEKHMGISHGSTVIASLKTCKWHTVLLSQCMIWLNEVRKKYWIPMGNWKSCHQ